MEKSKILDLTRLSHAELKDYGNRYFAAADNVRAIECYSHAIKKNSHVSTYFSNRALCYFQTKQYEKALADCRRALELDSTNLKAFFFAGQCHLAQGQYEEAVAKLTTAHTLALENHRNFGDDITAAIRTAKRKRFEQLDEKRRSQEIELQTYLNRLIIEDAERRQSALVKKKDGEDFVAKEKVTNEKEENNDIASEGVTTPTDAHVSIVTPPSNPGKNDGTANMDAEAALRLRQVEEIFTEIDDRRKKREVPDCLCGQISFELMLDPVITPYGITYERHSIRSHLQQVGHFDPITRQPLTYDQLIPNLAMKEVVSKFLEENPWADGY